MIPKTAPPTWALIEALGGGHAPPSLAPHEKWPDWSPPPPPPFDPFPPQPPLQNLGEGRSPLVKEVPIPGSTYETLPKKPQQFTPAPTPDWFLEAPLPPRVFDRLLEELQTRRRDAEKKFLQDTNDANQKGYRAMDEAASRLFWDQMRRYDAPVGERYVAPDNYRGM